MIDVRTGNGFDVHATKPGEFIWLCGIKIPSKISLIGHSDADVALHSITDALLGTIGDGDIGQHFSPTDERWSNADSSIFLQEVVRTVKEKGGIINHLDVTIIGEHPKIAPHREFMKEKLSNILQIDITRISVKATTTEKLGFCGRGEGLAALATATVVF